MYICGNLILFFYILNYNHEVYFTGNISSAHCVLTCRGCHITLGRDYNSAGMVGGIETLLLYD